MAADLDHTKLAWLMPPQVIWRWKADNNYDQVYADKYYWMTLENVITLASRIAELLECSLGTQLTLIIWGDKLINRHKHLND